MIKIACVSAANRDVTERPTQSEIPSFVSLFKFRQLKRCRDRKMIGQMIEFVKQTGLSEIKIIFYKFVYEFTKEIDCHQVFFFFNCALRYLVSSIQLTMYAFVANLEPV